MTSIFYMLIGLGALIFFHELGHFLLAKREGVKVDKFSLGFGPKLLGFKKGDTEYMLSLIPLGGYVKMAGMVDESMDTESIKGEPWEFLSKNVWQRMRIIVAGPFMNFVLAFIIFAIVGVSHYSTKIAVVNKETPAAVAGIKEGDRIIKVNDVDVALWDDLVMQIQPNYGKEISLLVLRDGQEISVKAVPETREVEDSEGKKHNVGFLGVSPVNEIKEEYRGFFGRVSGGFLYTAKITGATYKGIWMLLTNQVSASNVHGPIFIAKLSGKMAEYGFFNFLTFVAIISINLAVLNLLPIPILDGGHCLFLLVEALKGSPLSIKAQDLSQKVGMSLLLALMLYATYNDIIDLFIKK